MTRRTFARATLVIAAGLLLLTATPGRAAETADGDAAVENSADAGKPLVLTNAAKSRTQKVSRARKAAKIAALKASKSRAIAARKAKAAETKVVMAPAPEAEIPATVANANAQMPAADARGKAFITDTAPLETAAADQLSELGKSLTTPAVADEPRRIAQLVVTDQPQTAVPVVSPEPPRPVTQASAAASNDAWAQSSLIGKIFIAFGGMLTLASAARMLIA